MFIEFLRLNFSIASKFCSFALFTYAILETSRGKSLFPTNVGTHDELSSFFIKNQIDHQQKKNIPMMENEHKKITKPLRKLFYVLFVRLNLICPCFKVSFYVGFLFVCLFCIKTRFIKKKKEKVLFRRLNFSISPP